MRSYAIGDIHGHLDKLLEAHRRIARDRARTGDTDAPVIHLGDMVDRGPDSAGVIGHLAAGLAAGAPWVALKGNHDRMFAGFLNDPHFRDPGLRTGISWLEPKLGGLATLASYGINAGDRDPEAVQAEALRRIPESHRAFLASRPALHLRGGLLFVHAGIRPAVPLDQQSEDDLLWIRAPFLDDNRDHGVLVVHGHTALTAATHHGNRVNLDFGAGHGRDLSVAVFEGRDTWILTEDGREALRAPY